MRDKATEISPMNKATEISPMNNGTICAVPSGAGRVGIAVLRLSGQANGVAEFRGRPQKPGESARLADADRGVRCMGSRTVERGNKRRARIARHLAEPRGVGLLRRGVSYCRLERASVRYAPALPHPPRQGVVYVRTSRSLGRGLGRSEPRRSRHQGRFGGDANRNRRIET
jgi:hypothetical protein